MIMMLIIKHAIVLFYQEVPPLRDGWRTATACFGSDIKCSQYELQCPPGSHIALGRLWYGRKTGIEVCLFGVSNCNTTAARVCCNYNSRDEFWEFTEANRSSVVERCEGKQSCKDWAPRSSSTPSSHYVYMTYACLTVSNSVGMCTQTTLTSNSLFLEFNLSQDYKLPSLINGTNDCSCRITAENCHAKLNMTTSTSSASSDMSSESRSTHFVSTNGADETTTIATKDTNGGNKEGLIIGITVAVVLIILILVAIAMLCLCVRIKRKEAVRRDSIRNTNIFYSFPQDLEDTESIQCSNAVSTPREATMFPADLFQPDLGTNIKAPKESTVGRLQFESYTNEHVTKDQGIYSENNGEFSRMPNDSFASETSEETIAFDNETVHIMPENGDVKTSMNGVKSVSFDQNALYAKVIKEGKTKL
ncbi:hypothetical protein MAR_018948 [Mya arenaria]|uniref:Uncharacterized protein n=1 Tax=Mya arenaria TaxID=6604 RepID=A0ABY7EG48_MYAAR|nr:hypothetical protein MAR_018948 [Mya arenaria]